MANREWFGAQMRRLYEAKGITFDDAQARLYLERLGRTIPVPGSESATEPLFTDRELKSAFDRALDEWSDFGICDIPTLLRFAWEARRRLRPETRYKPLTPPTPADLAAASRQWREALGPKPVPAPPEEHKQAPPMVPASSETWDKVERIVQKLIGPPPGGRERRRA